MADRVTQRMLDLERAEAVAELNAERKSVLASRAVAAAIAEHQAAEERKRRIREERRALEERYGGGWTRDPDLERAAARTESTKRQRRSTYTDVLYAPAPQIAAPSVVLGGPVLHARDPHLWDVEVYTSAAIGPSFTGFKLPEYVSMRDRIRAEIADRTGVDESDITTSPVCMNTIGSSIKSVLQREAAGDVYGMMLQLRATVSTQEALTALLAAPQLTSRTVRWSGALQHDDGATYELLMYPHSILESTTSGGTGRRLIIPHDGRTPYMTSNSSDATTPSWIDLEALASAWDPAILRPDDRTYTTPLPTALFEIMLISSAAGWEGHFVRLS